MANKAVRTTDETGGFQDLLLPLFLTSQVSEGVNDDAEDEIKNNDDDNEEEQKVVNHSGCEQRLLNGPVMGIIYKKKNELTAHHKLFAFHLNHVQFTKNTT